MQFGGQAWARGSPWNLGQEPSVRCRGQASGARPGGRFAQSEEQNLGGMQRFGLRSPLQRIVRIAAR